MNFWKNIFGSADAIDSEAKQSLPRIAINSKQKKHPIVVAITNGDIEIVKDLLEHNPDLV